MATLERRKAEDVPEEDWLKAYKLIDDGMAVSEAARQLSVGRATLDRRHKQRVTGVSRRGPKPFIGSRGEKVLVKWLLVHERIGKCVSLKVLSTVAARIASDLGIEGFKAGRDWLDRFFKRHPELSKRTAEKTERSRMYAVNPYAIKEYFAKLAPHVKDLEAHKIWNMDEWGFDLMNINSGKVWQYDSAQISTAYAWYTRRAPTVAPDAPLPLPITLTLGCGVEGRKARTSDVRRRPHAHIPRRLPERRRRIHLARTSCEGQQQHAWSAGQEGDDELLARGCVLAH